jgi:hypothetical protein
MGSSNLGVLAITNPIWHQLNPFLRPRLSSFGPSRRFGHSRYFRFGRERTLVNRMPDWLRGEIERMQDRIEINPKVVLGKPIIRGTGRYPARARSGAS